MSRDQNESKKKKGPQQGFLKKRKHRVTLWRLRVTLWKDCKAVWKKHIRLLTLYRVGRNAKTVQKND